MPVLPTVAELLAQSKQAHTEYRRFAGSVDKKGKMIQPYDEQRCVAAVERAKSTREQAHALDPEHSDPAWQTNGVMHTELLAFYEKFLA
ncbi:MAG TPA: hypothetical protein VJ865_11375 [Gemmatimonadaceae bacterium]|nr:hypothetical protein [Gemmatimonadaceae bacterium]